MATNSTIYKVDLQISNMDTHYYQQHQLTIAKHPSETDERLMIRLLAFALYADERLNFGKDISKDTESDEEPALGIKDHSGNLKLWIDIGLPNERRIRKACGRATQVVIVTYGRRATAESWWLQNSKNLAKKNNLTVIYFPAEATQTAAKMAARNMQISCNIEDGQISLIGEFETVIIDLVFFRK